MTAGEWSEPGWLEQGDKALARGDWQAARTAFQAALAIRESPRALEGFGRATWWLDDLDATFPARQRAFQLYREQGDDRGAARVALALSVDYFDILGEPSVGKGWLQRSASLLQTIEETADHGWFQIYSALYLVEGDGDYDGGLKLARKAREIGRRLGVFDLEMLAAAGEGYCRLRAGEVVEGLRLMDEATAAAISGEIHDLTAAGATCCALMYSCAAIADYERAFHWSLRAQELCKRWGLRSFFSICRVHYAHTLIQRGIWPEAEAELTDLLEQPGPARQPTIEDASLKLAELRRRQGRFDEAEALYAKAPHRPLAIIGQAHIAILRDNDSEAAADLVERFLRRIGDEDRAERAFALDLLIQCHLAHGNTGTAAALLPEIAALALMTKTPMLLATHRLAQARLCAAEGDLEGSRRSLEDAVDLFGQGGAPYEAATARLALAEVLHRLSRTANARREARTAFETFRTLGARHDATSALSFLRRVDDHTPAPDSSGLSRRETEVLARIASGRNNAEIADELVLSVRTVERHISSIYEKLGLNGPSARAAATAYAIANGLTGH